MADDSHLTVSAHTSHARRAACVVLDIDGVLADVRHRLRHIARRPKDWDAFFAGAKDDPVLEIGAEFARTAATTHDVLYLTGRPERVRLDTEDWLLRNEFPCGKLLMRADGDHRPAAVVKLQHLRELRRELPIDLLVDDDPAVLKAARGAGFTVKLADWMPRDTPALLDAQEGDGLT